MSDSKYIDYDFDNPPDFAEFLAKVEARVIEAAEKKASGKSPNADAHPKPPQYVAEMYNLWTGGD